MRTQTSIITAVLLVASIDFAGAENTWVIDSQSEWQNSTAAQSNLEIEEGVAAPTQEEATFRSTLKTFTEKRSARSVVFDQSPIWQNWNPVENIGPSNLQDAPVALVIGPDNYWYFGRYGRGQKRRRGQTPQKLPPFTPQPAGEKKVATQLGVQRHAMENVHRVVELVRSKAIGEITEVYTNDSLSQGPSNYA